MRILEATAEDGIEMFISERFKADYVYMYPPRQAYSAFGGIDLDSRIRASLDASSELNIYVHFPFCRQVCAFCNLYTIGIAREDQVSIYLSALKAEIAYWARRVDRPTIRTIYFGGGTPSLLSAEKLGDILKTLALAFACDLSEVEEVALEVSPETVTADGYRALRSVGFNRVNLGVQSLSDAELTQFGRQYGSSVAAASVAEALAADFDNVCVDLIFGLAGQSDASWRESVRAVASLRPQTVCTYALTTRPQTGYAANGFCDVEPALLYRRYGDARELLAASGYMAENHVRYISSPAGGYRQKANHWAGENVLGIGAGARSYLRECDFQNGYSLHQRRKTLASYVDQALSSKSPITAGYIMDMDEQRRKSVVLGLFKLDRRQYRSAFGNDVLMDFHTEFAMLVSGGLVEIGGDHIKLTERGARIRDNIVQLFFSKQVRTRSANYGYIQ